MQQNPSLGRVVLVKVNPAQNNGSDTAHASISRVWTDRMVNLRVMLDTFTTPLSMTSVPIFDTEAEAVANGPHACFWPPRV